MPRIFQTFLAALALLLMGAVALPSLKSQTYVAQILGVSEAQAQQAGKKKRRSLFRILFGRKTAKKKAVTTRKKRTTKRRKKVTKRTRKKTRSKTASRKKSSGKRVKRAAVAIPKKEVVDKLEDAKVVLIVGDFFAGGLADGLERGLSDVASLRIVDKSNGLSGFVRNDIVDWPKRLPSLLEEFKPAYVVAMLGSNDRQLLREDGKKLKKRTPEWDAAYIKRVNSLGAVLKASNVPYTWVGLPPVRFKRMNTDFLYFNELYGKAARSPKGEFVDVWDGFSDAEGNYSRSGPDVNGQIVMLRPKDGINITKAGRRRLAFYVEATILRKLGGSGDAPGIGTAFDFESVAPKEAAYDPERTGRTIVVRLDDPSADGGEILAGEKIDTTSALGNTLAVPVLNGPARVIRREGRVDSFSWPPTGQTPNSSSPAVASSN